MFSLTTQMLNAFDDTWTMLVAFYLAARLFMGSYYGMICILIPMIRGMMVAHIIMTLISSALWIGSVHVDYPNRLILVWLAIFVDLTGAMFIILFVKMAKFISKGLGEWMDKIFEFYPAVNIEHKVERTNAFVTLVFGYSVVAIIYQSSAPHGVDSFLGKAILGLIQAFCFNWIYFELDGADLFAHAIRRSMTAGKILSPLPNSFSNSNKQCYGPPPTSPSSCPMSSGRQLSLN
jgi:low temperature requirement protein LtrA